MCVALRAYPCCPVCTAVVLAERDQERALDVLRAQRRGRTDSSVTVQTDKAGKQHFYSSDLPKDTEAERQME